MPPWDKYKPPNAAESQASAAAPWEKYGGESAAPQVSRGALGTIDDTVRMIASGATFGFADELAAKADEATGRGADYATNVANERTRDKDIESRMPVTSMVAKITGALLNPLTRRGFGVNSVMAPGYLNLGAQGVIQGALTGAGESTESNREMGALTGGVAGGALGVAIPAAINAGRSVMSGIADKFSEPATRAARRIMAALQRDGMSIDEAEAAIKALGPDATIADLGGNVRGLAEAAAQTPGKALKAAENLVVRQGGQGDRLVADALKATGADSVESLIEQRAAAARPWYEKAFSQDNYRTLRSDLIKRLSTRPDFQDGVRAGIKDLQDEAAITGEDLRAFNDYFEGANLDDPNLKLIKEPTLRIIDAAKRGMDRLLYDNSNSKYFKETGEHTQAGMRLQQMRNALMKEVDRLTAGTPEGDAYKMARAAWGGPTDVISGLSLIQRTVNKAQDTADVTKKLFGSKDARAKLKTLFGNIPGAFDDFAKSVGREKTFAETQRAVAGNSRTAYRQAAQSDMADDSVDAAFDLARNPSTANLIDKGLTTARNWMKRPPAQVADELAPMFSNDPAVRDAALNELRKRVGGTSLLNQGMLPFSKSGNLLSGAARIGGYAGGQLGSP